MCNCIVVQNGFIVLGLWICTLKLDNLCQGPYGFNDRFYNGRTLIKLGIFIVWRKTIQPEAGYLNAASCTSFSGHVILVLQI